MSSSEQFRQDVIEKFGLRDIRTKAIEAKLSNLSQDIEKPILTPGGTCAEGFGARLKAIPKLFATYLRGP